MSNGARRALESGAGVEEVFLAEARERLSEVQRILAAGFPGPDDHGLRELFRHAHTFKGLGGSLGFEGVEEEAEPLTELLRGLSQRDEPASEEERERVVQGFDRLRSLVDEVARSRAQV